MQDSQGQKSRLQALLAGDKRPLLSIYLTAGYPQLDSTLRVCGELANAGVDFIELGFPFSDPLADGLTLQRSATQALANGMTMSLYFKQLMLLRNTIDIPVLFMGYFNNVLSYGVERFCEACNHVGIDGAIIPDLPPEIYLESYASIFKRAGLDNIFLISPDTSDERIRYLDYHATGFLYVVSGRRITGESHVINGAVVDYLKHLNALNLRNPMLVGFGISSSDDVAAVAPYVRGIIVGSAVVKLLDCYPELNDVSRFVSSLAGRR